MSVLCLKHSALWVGGGLGTQQPSASLAYLDSQWTPARRGREDARM